MDLNKDKSLAIINESEYSESDDSISESSMTNDSDSENSSEINTVLFDLK